MQFESFQLLLVNAHAIQPVLTETGGDQMTLNFLVFGARLKKFVKIGDEICLDDEIIMNHIFTAYLKSNK